MGIDSIINLLIIFFVVYSVVKRAKAVTSKAGDLEEKPSGVQSSKPVMREQQESQPQRPKMLRQLLKELEKQVIVPDESPQNVPQTNRTMQSTFGKPGEIVEYDSDFSTETVDVSAESLDSSVLEQIETVIFPDRSYKVKTEIQSSDNSELSFRGPELVKAIVMSEILAEPVSLR